MRAVVIAALVLLGNACAESPPATLRCTPETPPAQPPPSFRRLTNLEFDQTLRDLLGDTSRPSRGFSRDAVAYLFPTNAEAQRVSSVDLDRTLDAVLAVVERAWDRREREPLPVAVGDFQGERVPTPGFPAGEAWSLSPGRPLGLRLGPADGPVALSLVLRGPPGTRLELSQNGESLAFVTLPTPSGGADTVTLSVVAHPEVDPILPDGRTELVLGLADQTSAPARVLAAVDGALAPSLREDQRLVRCDMEALGPEVCARRIVEPFATRAWRRPLAADELEGLLRVYTVEREREGFAGAVQLALAAVLLSPRFWLLTQPVTEGLGARSLTPYELASRLSYFLWGSLPDQALLTAAAEGALGTASELEAQTRRMVADARFQGFLRGFAGHWLAFEGLRAEDPTNKAFPELRRSAVGETSRFTAALFREDRPAGELLGAPYAWVDGTLASHYELSLPADTVGFVRVPLADAPRRGLLTQASYLTLTSTVPTTTQPTLRGLYILTRFLCDPPEPPPANTTFDSFAMAADQGRSLRQALEAHRARPECAGCHRVMDTLGFAFERYDTLGRFRREFPGGLPDTSGDVEGVGRFGDAVELSMLLRDHSRLTPCVAQHLLTYALGRNVAESDPGVAEALSRSADGASRGLLGLLVRVVTHPLFARRASGTGP